MRTLSYKSTPRPYARTNTNTNTIDTYRQYRRDTPNSEAPWQGLTNPTQATLESHPWQTTNRFERCGSAEKRSHSASLLAVLLESKRSERTAGSGSVCACVGRYRFLKRKNSIAPFSLLTTTQQKMEEAPLFRKSCWNFRSQFDSIGIVQLPTI